MLPEGFHPGDPFGQIDNRRRRVLDDAACRPLNAMLAEIRRLGRVTVAPPLEHGSGPSGRTWGLSRAEPLYAKITGGGSPYSWSEAYRTDGGTSALVAGGRTGTAYEVNGVGGLGGQYVTIHWTVAGDWRFQIARGGQGGTDSDSTTLANCFCSPIPKTLTMISADPLCNFEMFQSCTIHYGPTPPEYLTLNIGNNSFLSTASFPDPLAGGALFRYFFTCQFNQFSLTRVYITSPYGSPYRDGILYTWLLGAAGNSCTPFRLDNGNAFPGSDQSCGVKIDG